MTEWRGSISRAACLDHPVPHYSHLGTVWLPLQHLLLLPFVQNDFLWSTGLAGSIVSALAFCAACYCLFELSRLLHGSEWAGVLSAAAFVVNPNILYLQSTPLGEMLYIALFLAALLALVKFCRAGFGRRLPWPAVAVSFWHP